MRGIIIAPGRASALRLTGLCGIVALLVLLPSDAHAQGDPFEKATEAAQAARDGLRTLSLSIGMVGMIACLMLGFFDKLNWKWVATGIGVSFALSIVPQTISWLAGMG